MNYFSVFLFFVFLNLAIANEKEIKKSAFIPSNYAIQLKLPDEAEKSNWLWPEVMATGKVRVWGVMKQFLKESNETNSNLINFSFNFNNIKINNESHSITVADSEGGPINIKNIKQIIENEFDDQAILQIELDRNFEADEGLDIKLEYFIRTISGQSSTYKNNSVIRSFEYEADDFTKGSYIFTPLTWLGIRHSTLFPFTNEPNHLANFQLHLIRNVNDTSISNVPLERSIPDPKDVNWVHDIFELTPPMTVEHLAFFVGDFAHVQKHAKDNTKIIFHLPKHLLKANISEFSLNAITSILDFYGDYFKDSGITNSLFPFEELNIILSCGEHLHSHRPGIITFPVNKWICSKDIPPIQLERYKQLITLQSIGPLLLPYFLSYTSALFDPDQNSISRNNQPLSFLYNYLVEEAMANLSQEFLWNGTLNTRRLCTMQNIFARKFTYKKDELHGADGELCDGIYSHIMSMLADENILGRETVNKAVNSFRNKLILKSFISGRTLGEEESTLLFMNSLQDASEDKLPENLHVTEIFQSWEKQWKDKVRANVAKYQQRLRVKVDIVNETHISLKQERIPVWNDFDDEELKNATWHLPVIVASDQGTLNVVWLSENNETITIPVEVSKYKWIILNPNATGIHQTLYDPALLEKIQKTLISNHEVFHPLARIRLLDDYMNFVNAKSPIDGELVKKKNYTNLVPISEAQNILAYIHAEKDLLVWYKIFEIFSFLERYGGKSLWRLSPGLKQSLSIASAQFLNSTNIKDLHKHPIVQMNLEAEVLFSACSIESSLCKEKTENLIKDWKESKSLFSFKEELPTMKALLGTIVMGGGDEGLKFMIEKYFKRENGEKVCYGYEFTEQVENTLYPALATVTDFENFERLVNITLEEDTLLACYTEEDKPTKQRMIVLLLGNMMRYIVDGFYTNYFYENCDKIVESFIGDFQSHELQFSFIYLMPKSYSTDALDKLKTFVNAKPNCLNGVPTGFVIGAQQDEVAGINK